MQRKAQFLPSDEQIYERSKDWANFFSRIVKEENFQDVYYDDIESVFGEDKEEDEDEDSEVDVGEENTPVNGCGALMKIEKFEASSPSSDDFDHENLLNETRHLIDERKRKWKEAGMDRVLDTFDFNAITDKVGSWLRKTKQSRQLPSDVSMHEVHFENHQYELNSDDSFQSADTAKYILSNRKPRSASCTKMIIKRFRYVKGKRKELQNKYNCLDENELKLEELFDKKAAYMQQARNRDRAPYDYDECGTPTTHNSNYASKRQTVERPRECAVQKYKQYCDMSGVKPLIASCKTPKAQSKVNLEAYSKTTALTHETARKHKSRYRKRRSEKFRNRSTSRSSSCTSDHSASNAKPRFRKFSRKSKRLETIDLSLVSTSSCDDTKADKTEPHTSPQNSQLHAKAATKKGPNSDVTCFLPEHIVNSTAINVKKVPSKVKTCQLSPVKTQISRESASAKSASSSSKSAKNEKEHLSNKQPDTQPHGQRKESIESRSSIDSKSSDKRIMLYNPQNENLYNESINRGCFVLTEDYLKKLVGKKQAQRFITFNERKFPLKFNVSSTVYFMLPADSENSHPSGSSAESDDEDVLNMFGKQGSLVEQTSLN